MCCCAGEEDINISVASKGAPVDTEKKDEMGNNKRTALCAKMFDCDIADCTYTHAKSDRHQGTNSRVSYFTFFLRKLTYFLQHVCFCKKT
jgi:hypothetical protein